MSFLSGVFLTQEQKEAEIKKLRQSLKFKATPTPDLYRGHKLSKTTSEKVYYCILQSV